MDMPPDVFQAMYSHVEGGELTAVQQVVSDGGRTDAFELEVLFHPIAELTH